MRAITKNAITIRITRLTTRDTTGTSVTLLPMRSITQENGRRWLGQLSKSNTSPANAAAERETERVF